MSKAAANDRNGGVDHAATGGRTGTARKSRIDFDLFSAQSLGANILNFQKDVFRHDEQ
jgi:hypothetical protein